MTHHPFVTRDIHGLAGPEYPRYRVGPLCSNPNCSRPADHTHHLVRRSFLGGDFAWIKLPDGSVVGNLTGLDWRCHQLITENITRIIWNEETKLYEWVDGDGEVTGPLNPQPPMFGRVTQLEGITAETFGGPASREKCETCGRVLPHKHDGPKQEKRRRKTWVVSVPDDAEDGAMVLDLLLDGCRELFGHDENANTRYFSLIQALSLILQNKEKIVADV